MNKNIKRTYQPPTCFCVEVHNKTLICESMGSEDIAGVKEQVDAERTQSIWDLYIK